MINLPYGVVRLNSGRTIGRGGNICHIFQREQSRASSSTPHLYISALATWPRNAEPCQGWRSHFSGIPRFTNASRNSAPRTSFKFSRGLRTSSHRYDFTLVCQWWPPSLSSPFLSWHYASAYFLVAHQFSVLLLCCSSHFSNHCAEPFLSCSLHWLVGCSENLQKGENWRN